MVGEFEGPVGAVDLREQDGRVAVSAAVACYVQRCSAYHERLEDLLKEFMK